MFKHCNGVMESAPENGNYQNVSLSLSLSLSLSKPSKNKKTKSLVDWWKVLSWFTSTSLDLLFSREREALDLCCSFFHGAPMRRIVKDCGSEIWQRNSTMWEIKPVAIEHINEVSYCCLSRCLCEIVRAPSYISTT